MTVAFIDSNPYLDISSKPIEVIEGLFYLTPMWLGDRLDMAVSFDDVLYTIDKGNPVYIEYPYTLN